MNGDNSPIPELPDLAGQTPLAGDREVEIKFSTDAAGLRQALQSELLAIGQKDRPRRTLRATYFDSSLGDLRNRSISLRIRRARGKLFMGFKRSLPLIEGAFSRREVEHRVATAEPDISMLGPDVAAELDSILQGRPLQPQFETIVKRLTRTLDFGRCQVEVAFDSGIVTAGDRQDEFSELEFELKSGDEASLYDLAIDVAKTLPLRLGTLSKADRGYLLLSGNGFDSARAANLQLPPDASLDDTIGATIRASINHFTANWTAFNLSVHAEVVHQMRVALRRLRAALSLYDQAFPCAEFEHLRTEASRIASSLGLARDWDVFLGLIETGPLREHSEEAHFATILQVIGERRQKSYAGANTIVSERIATRFVLEIHSFLAHHGWRNALSATDLARLVEPTKGFAQQILKRLHRRVLKRGRRPENLSSEQRHRLRIAVKHLRYASEFFGSAFGAAANVRTFIRAVAILQDALGAFNDRTIAMRMLEHIEDEVGTTGAKAVGIVIGWYGRETTIVDKRLGKAWKVFKKTAIFWD